jgi:Ca2+-binding EF-hand superfamily protein
VKLQEVAKIDDDQNGAINLGVLLRILAQTRGKDGTPSIHTDNLFMEQDSLQNGGRSSIRESESAEIEPTLADAVRQGDA